MRSRTPTLQRVVRHLRKKLCDLTELREEAGREDSGRRKTFERAVWNAICFDTFDLEDTANVLVRPGA